MKFTSSFDITSHDLDMDVKPYPNLKHMQLLTFNWGQLLAAALAMSASWGMVTSNLDSLCETACCSSPKNCADFISI